jgi:hypothetical protein
MFCAVAAISCLCAMKVLLIENEPDLAQSIIEYLSGEDF